MEIFIFLNKKLLLFFKTDYFLIYKKVIKQN